MSDMNYWTMAKRIALLDAMNGFSPTIKIIWQEVILGENQQKKP